jgi:hypothetical protein
VEREMEGGVEERKRVSQSKHNKKGGNRNEINCKLRKEENKKKKRENTPKEKRINTQAGTQI